MVVGVEWRGRQGYCSEVEQWANKHFVCGEECKLATLIECSAKSADEVEVAVTGFHVMRPIPCVGEGRA